MVIKRFAGFLIFTFLFFAAGESYTLAQTSKRKKHRIEKSMAGSKRRAPREKKAREPRAVTKAKKEQENREAKRERDYKKAVENNKKRHYSIQTEDVKARMKQNEKDIKARDREKRKKERRAARGPGSTKKKYKK